MVFKCNEKWASEQAEAHMMAALQLFLHALVPSLFVFPGDGDKALPGCPLTCRLITKGHPTGTQCWPLTQKVTHWTGGLGGRGGFGGKMRAGEVGQDLQMNSPSVSPLHFTILLQQVSSTISWLVVWLLAQAGVNAYRWHCFWIRASSLALACCCIHSNQTKEVIGQKLRA